MKASHYFVVDLNHHSGGSTRFPFLNEDAAGRCLDHYRKQAFRQAADAQGATVATSGTGVIFSWDSPAGQIRWSAELSRLSTDDHLYPAPAIHDAPLGTTRAIQA